MFFSKKERMDAFHKISILMRKMKQEEVLEEILGYPEFSEMCVSTFRSNHLKELGELATLLKKVRWCIPRDVQVVEADMMARLLLLCFITGREPSKIFESKRDFEDEMKRHGFYDMPRKMTRMDHNEFVEFIFSKYY